MGPTLQETGKQNLQIEAPPRRPSVYHGPSFTILHQADPYLASEITATGYAFRVLFFFVGFLIGSLI